MHQNAFGGRSPAGGAYSAERIPKPSSWIKGEGKERGGVRNGKEREFGWEKERRGPPMSKVR